MKQNAKVNSPYHIRLKNFLNMCCWKIL